MCSANPWTRYTTALGLGTTLTNLNAINSLILCQCTIHDRTANGLGCQLNKILDESKNNVPWLVWINWGKRVGSGVILARGVSDFSSPNKRTTTTALAATTATAALIPPQNASSLIANPHDYNRYRESLMRHSKRGRKEAVLSDFQTTSW